MTISQNLNELPPELNELKALKNWVCYKIEPRPTKDDPNHMGKVPYNPITGKGARANDPGTWTDYETARKAAESGKYTGIGFEFGNSGYCGIDLDHCATAEGKITDAAAAVVEKLNSYTEYSISGTGLHTLAKSSPLKETGYTKPKNGDLKELEVYRPRKKENGEFPGEIEGGRFFTISGNVYGEAKAIADRTEEVKALINRYWPPELPRPVETQYKTTGRAATGEDDRKMIDSALKAIDPGALVFEEWAAIMTALRVTGYSLSEAEDWSAGNLCGRPNQKNDTKANARRWYKFHFNKGDDRAAGVIISTAKRLGWRPAEAFDEKARAEYGRSLYSDEQRREYGRRKHEERAADYWNSHGRDGFQQWKEKHAAGVADPGQREPTSDKITPDDLRVWMSERRAQK